jgi:hypothetical protein
LPAQGGAEPESLDAIRLNAPEAFRTQERAVTTDDYARAAERHPDVQRAAARLRWTGSWYTVFLMLDRRDGKPVDAAFKATMRAFLERFRLAGYDFEFADPVHVPLDIQLQICVASGYFAADVKAALLEAFTASVDRHGRPGFFHPDGFTFGTPLYLSAVVATSHGRGRRRLGRHPPLPALGTQRQGRAGGWRHHGLAARSPARRRRPRISLKTARSASLWRGDHEHFRQLRLLRRRHAADPGRRHPAPRPAGAGACASALTAASGKACWPTSPTSPPSKT